MLSKVIDTRREPKIIDTEVEGLVWVLIYTKPNYVCSVHRSYTNAVREVVKWSKEGYKEDDLIMFTTNLIKPTDESY